MRSINPRDAAMRAGKGKGCDSGGGAAGSASCAGGSAGARSTISRGGGGARRKGSRGEVIERLATAPAEKNSPARPANRVIGIVFGKSGKLGDRAREMMRASGGVKLALARAP